MPAETDTPAPSMTTTPPGSVGGDCSSCATRCRLSGSPVVAVDNMELAEARGLGSDHRHLQRESNRILSTGARARAARLGLCCAWSVAAAGLRNSAFFSCWYKNIIARAARTRAARSARSARRAAARGAENQGRASATQKSHFRVRHFGTTVENANKWRGNGAAPRVSARGARQATLSGALPLAGGDVNIEKNRLKWTVRLKISRLRRAGGGLAPPHPPCEVVVKLR